MERRCSEGPTICKNGDPSLAVAGSWCRFWSNKTASQARFAARSALLAADQSRDFASTSTVAVMSGASRSERARPHALFPPRQRWIVAHRTMTLFDLAGPGLGQPLSL